MVTAAEPKAEPHARPIEAYAWTVAVAGTIGVAGIVVVVAIVGAIAPEAPIVRTETMTPDAGPAMHVGGRVNISDGARQGLRPGKPDRAGGVGEKPRRRQHGGARQGAKGFL